MNFITPTGEFWPNENPMREDVCRVPPPKKRRTKIVSIDNQIGLPGAHCVRRGSVNGSRTGDEYYHLNEIYFESKSNLIFH